MRKLSDVPVMIFDHNSKEITKGRRSGLFLAATSGHLVSSYFELLQKIAILSYSNPHFKLLYRGQREDHRLNINGDKGGRGNLFPTILRPELGCERETMLEKRFQRLREAEIMLIQALPIPDIISLRVVRWAILQHYQVCETPLLDVTQSLQCALSFAAGGDNTGYLFVLAVPQISGPVSISTESMTQTIDLTQICPPEALRPHVQSGFLLGDYPEYADRLQTHQGNGFVANDFACRLLTKFHLEKFDSWHHEGFRATKKGNLCPGQKQDKWFAILDKIKSAMSPSDPQNTSPSKSRAIIGPRHK